MLEKLKFTNYDLNIEELAKKMINDSKCKNINQVFEENSYNFRRLKDAIIGAYSDNINNNFIDFAKLNISYKPYLENNFVLTRNVVNNIIVICLNANLYIYFLDEIIDEYYNDQNNYSVISISSQTKSCCSCNADAFIDFGVIRGGTNEYDRLVYANANLNNFYLNYHSYYHNDVPLYLWQEVTNSFNFVSSTNNYNADSLNTFSSTDGYNNERN